MKIETAIKLLEECEVDCADPERTQKALWMAIDALKQKLRVIERKNGLLNRQRRSNESNNRN